MVAVIEAGHSVQYQTTPLCLCGSNFSTTKEISGESVKMQLAFIPRDSDCTVPGLSLDSSILNKNLI